MTANHHPLPETLISFASGTLPNAMSAVVACHLTLCARCTEAVRHLEILGGFLLDRLDTGPAEKTIAERALACWSAKRALERAERHPNMEAHYQTLRTLLAHNVASDGAIAWQRASGGVRHHRIALPDGSGEMQLLRLTPGEFLPGRLSRADIEIALVLQGVLSGGTGDYLRGDIVEREDGGRDKLRAAGDTDCICLVAGERRPRAAAELYRTLGGLREMAVPQARRLGDALRVRAALAASLALIAGIGLGWLARGAPEPRIAADFVKENGNRLVAQGELQKVLDALPSGGERVAKSDGRDFRLRIRMTFQDQSGDYCRQYEIIAASSGRYSGIACRKGGMWVVTIQALVPPSLSASEQPIPASADAHAAMDAVVGSLISGDPLAAKDETALIAKAWKK